MSNYGIPETNKQYDDLVRISPPKGRGVEKNLRVLIEPERVLDMVELIVPNESHCSDQASDSSSSECSSTEAK